MSEHQTITEAVVAAIRAALPEIAATLRDAVQTLPQEVVRPNRTHLYIGVKATARDELVAKGKLKPPIQLADRAVGFLAGDLLDYQRVCIAERDAKLAERDAKAATPAPIKPNSRRKRT